MKQIIIIVDGKKYLAQEVIEKSKNGRPVTKESKYDGDRPDWSTDVERAAFEMFKIIGSSRLSFSDLVDAIEEELKVRNAVAQGMVKDYTAPDRPWRIFKKVGTKKNRRYIFNIDTI